jgi:hypothetical protein
VSRAEWSNVNEDAALPLVHDPERAIGCTASPSAWFETFAIWFLAGW